MGASWSLAILFRYLPLDPAYKAGLARQETGQELKGMHLISLHPFDSLKLFVLMWQ
jgi:hypothetical protein